LDGAMDADLLSEVQRTPDGRCVEGFRDEKSGGREDSMRLQRGAKGVSCDWVERASLRPD
jgi:hypothetical protein